jgi:hypothetical protein
MKGSTDDERIDQVLNDCHREVTIEQPDFHQNSLEEQEFKLDSSGVGSHDSSELREAVQPITEVKSTSRVAMVLQLYLSKNFSMLSESISGEGGSSRQVYPENFSSLSQSKLHQAIRKRKIVAEPVKTLISSGNFSLMREAAEADLVKLKKNEVKLLLVNRQTKTVLACLKRVRRSSSSSHPLLKRFDVIAEICCLFKDVELIPDAILILSMVHPDDIESLHFEQLIFFTRKLINPQNERSSRNLANAVNPIGLCIVLSDFLDSIKTFSRHLHLSIENVSQSLVKVAKKISDEITTLTELDCIFSHRPLGTHQVIELLMDKPRKYRAFLNSPLTKQLTIKSWTGNFTFSLGFNQCSYVAKTAEKSRKPSKLWKMHTKTLHQKIFSIFQLQSWIYNCYTRHFVETLSTLAIVSLQVFTIVKYVNTAKQYKKPLDITLKSQDELTCDLDFIQNSSDILFLPFLFLLGIQAIIIFIHKLKSGMLLITDPRVPFDLTLVICAIFLRTRFLGSYNQMFVDGDVLYEYFWMVLGFCLFMRAFLCFAVDSNFGPILRMLYSTFIDIYKFLMIFAIILLVFSVSYHIVFYESPGYQTILECAATLFSAALGSYDFYVFVEREDLGYFALSVWIVIATIVILNVLIAFLSNRYEEMAPQTDADYVNLLYIYTQRIKFTPEYGGLVMFPLPFTILLIPFVPLYFLPIDKQRLSANLAKLSYLPMFLVALIVFALQCVVVSLCSYFKNFFILAVELNTRLHKRVRNLAKWVIVGPFYLTYLSFASFPVLIRFLFAKESEDPFSLFTSNTQRFALAAFQDKLKASPSEEEIPLNEALALLDHKNFQAEIEHKVKLVIDEHSMLKSIVQDIDERFKYADKIRRCKEITAYKCMVMKLASFNSQTLNLKEAVQILQDSPSSLQTYSRYFTEKTLASLNEASTPNEA